MDNYVMLAKIFGPLLVIGGLWMLICKDRVVDVMTSMKETPSTFYLSGVCRLLVGLAIVNQYNVWEWQIGLLVTLLGWYLILRGVLAFFIPEVLVDLVMDNKAVMTFMGIIPVIWGVAIFWSTRG